MIILTTKLLSILFEWPLKTFYLGAKGDLNFLAGIVVVVVEMPRSTLECKFWKNLTILKRCLR
jgi:hypothetical protein